MASKFCFVILFVFYCSIKQKIRNIPHQKYETLNSFNELFNYIMCYYIALYFMSCMYIKLFRGTVNDVKLASQL